MSATQSHLMVQEWLDRRATKRFPVALPVILELGAKKLSARLIDLGVGGGRVEIGVIPIIHSDLRFRRGTISVLATVLWTRGSQIGLKFRSALTNEQIAEQVSRAQALALLRNSKLGSA